MNEQSYDAKTAISVLQDFAKEHGQIGRTYWGLRATVPTATLTVLFSLAKLMFKGNTPLLSSSKALLVYAACFIAIKQDKFFARKIKHCENIVDITNQYIDKATFGSEPLRLEANIRKTILNEADTKSKIKIGADEFHKNFRLYLLSIAAIVGSLQVYNTLPSKVKDDFDKSLSFVALPPRQGEERKGEKLARTLVMTR